MPAVDGVHARRRFVKVHHVRVADQSNRYRETALHPAGEGACALVGALGEPHLLDAAVRFGADVLRVDALDGPEELEVLLGREVVPQDVELGAYPHHAPHLGHAIGVRDRVAEDHGVAARRREPPGEHVDRRRLACTVWSKECKELALVHRVPRALDSVEGLAAARELLFEASDFDCSRWSHWLVEALLRRLFFADDIFVCACLYAL
mmetsp:Transcript_33878/g.66061  ORF Transcript_33878/g.66061 Transcript_33878/m.66061 type:complete len:207 (+) Transcript_33878:5447-6067(+)